MIVVRQRSNIRLIQDGIWRSTLPHRGGVSEWADSLDKRVNLPERPPAARLPGLQLLQRLQLARSGASTRPAPMLRTTLPRMSLRAASWTMRQIPACLLPRTAPAENGQRA